MLPLMIAEWLGGPEIFQPPKGNWIGLMMEVMFPLPSISMSQTCLENTKGIQDTGKVFDKKFSRLMHFKLLNFFGRLFTVSWNSGRQSKSCPR